MVKSNRRCSEECYRHRREIVQWRRGVSQQKSLYPVCCCGSHTQLQMGHTSVSQQHDEFGLVCAPLCLSCVIQVLHSEITHNHSFRMQVRRSKTHLLSWDGWVFQYSTLFSCCLYALKSQINMKIRLEYSVLFYFLYVGKNETAELYTHCKKHLF